MCGSADLDKQDDECAARIDALLRRLRRTFLGGHVLVGFACVMGVLGMVCALAASQGWHLARGEQTAMAICWAAGMAALAARQLVCGWRASRLVREAIRVETAWADAASAASPGEYDLDVLRSADGRLASAFMEFSSTEVGLLSRSARAALLEVIERARPRDSAAHRRLVLATLRAIAIAQDTRALPMIEALARSRTDPELASTAAEVRDELAELAEEAGTRHVLLRPAAAPVAETLLRPAAGAPAAETEHLLRPAEEQQAQSNRPGT